MPKAVSAWQLNQLLQVVPRATFGKEQRLLKSSEFAAVFESNRFRVARPQFLLLASPNHCDHMRLGLVVGKKNVPTAVQRNRIKRLVRESFRLQSFDCSLDVVFLARRDIKLLSNAELRALLDKCWVKLNQKAVEC